MAYVHKIIGSDEKLIGIGRLHWIYIAKGLVGFGLCVLLAWGLNTLVFSGLAWLSRMGGTVDPTMPFMIMNSYLMPVMMTVGAYIFLLHVILVMTTEIALTSRRVIHKKGLLFLHIKEVDLIEIKGETLDMGYFGRLFSYGYLLLDCRFLGDIRFPAIEKPERFLKALHRARADSSDAPTVFVPHTEQDQTDSKTDTFFVRQNNDDLPEITGPDSVATARAYLPQAQTPQHQPNITINHVDPQTVAQIVQQVMPQMVEKITEEMIAKGVIADPDNQETPMDVLEAELITTFDEASARPPTSRKVVH